MAGNDSGQIAFVGSLDGLTTAVMLYDRGHIDVLASAGVPGPLAGSFVWDFGFPGINKFGDVVVRVDVRGSASGLMLINRNGANYIVLEGQSVGSFGRLSSFITTRYSINDRGEVLFTAYFQESNNSRWRTGLFKYTSNGIEVMATTADFLPGIGANFEFNYFGLDANGFAYFSAYRDTNTGLYRTDGSTARKIAATGDFVEGSTITYLNAVSGFGLSADGTLAYAANLGNGNSIVARYRASEGQRTKIVSWVSQVHAVSVAGDVFFSGGTAQGWGVHNWSGETISSVLPSSTTVDGAPIINLSDAFVTSAGEVYVQVSTSTRSFALVQAPAARILFAQGSTVNVAATVTFLSLVPGARTGMPNLLTGGNATSVYELNLRTLVPVYIAGDNASPSGSWTITNAVRGSSGELYTAGDGGIYKHVRGHSDTVFKLPSGNIQWIPGWYDNVNAIAVNQSGVIAFPAWAETAYIVATLERGRTTVLMQLGGSSPTASPTGGTFNDWLPYIGAIVALDDAGRTMVGTQVRGGRSGLFIYENAQWHAAALFNSTQIDGEIVVDVNGLRAGGQKFYAQFITANGWVVAEYSDGTWKALIHSGNVMPNGASIYYLNRFDVNRTGEIAIVAQANSGSILALRTTDGIYHLVHSTSENTEAGDIFYSYQAFSISLLDDRKIYFTGIDILDRNLLYLAEPLF
jgi:hypothetical protein